MKSKELTTRQKLKVIALEMERLAARLQKEDKKHLMKLTTNLIRVVEHDEQTDFL